MPRLDIWLTQTGQVPSRQVAKRIIKEGHVTIDGKIAKPSTFVKGTENIVLSDDISLYPIGYNKLKAIDTMLGGNLISADDVVLDIGSSAGGFLQYLLEKGAHIIGIEVSETFFEILKEIERNNKGITMLFEDAFTIETTKICKFEELDLVIIDVTTDLSGTTKLIEKYIPLLKHGGQVIAAFKTDKESDVHTQIQSFSDRLINRQVININQERQEIHLVAIRQ